MVLHRSLLTTYSGNYSYGSSLYSHKSEDVEKKYRDTLSRTHLRSDRADLGLHAFTGSHLHGGTPASDAGSVSMPTSTSGSKAATHDLYAPLSFGYGREYYNNLRADYQKPKPKEAKIPKASDYFYATTTGLDEHSSGADVKTHSAKTTSTFDDAKKTITTTTTTERWVPLTSYLYGSYAPSYYYYSSGPYRTYRTTDDLYYSDDYNYYKSATSKSRNLDALDLNVSSYSMEKFDYNCWMEKCRDIQRHLDQVNQWVADAESKIKTDVVSSRNKMQSELMEVTMMVEDTSKYNEELQKVIKRQARQITDLHSQYEDINRHLAEVTDNLEKTRARCQTLQGELASVQSGFELAMRRK